jgi:hypothetical protein
VDDDPSAGAVLVAGRAVRDRVAGLLKRGYDGWIKPVMPWAVLGRD